MQPELSVVIPTHNRRPILERKLKAMAGENGPFEVIVVAAGCSDDTLEFLAGYRPPYPLTVIPGPDRFAAYSRNRGAEVAEGRVLLFTDDDVVSRPGFLAAHIGLHSRPGQVGVSRMVLPEHLKEGEVFAGRAYWWNANGRGTSIPAALFKQVGGYDESFDSYGGEDPDLGWRLSKAGAKFVYLPAAVAEHWDESYSASVGRKAFQAGEAHVRVWRKYGDNRVAWALGIHPLLLRAKLAFYSRTAERWGRRGEFELAYARGAWQELGVK